MILGLCLLAGSLQASLTGDALINELEHRAVTFFWQESSAKTGFTKDRAVNLGDSDDHTVASTASTGFALTAYPIGVTRGWLDRKKALERTRLTLSHILTDLPGTHGWYYHFIDWNTGARQWKCEVSTIDTSIMLAGVWIARQYWKDPEVTRDADAITKRIDWNWFMVDVDGKQPHDFFNMGWHPEDGFIHATWAGYCELLMLYIQAYGASNVRTAGWDRIEKRVFTDRGHTFIEGGPLFMHQMPYSFYNVSGRRDRGGYNYWIATREATLANRAYCIDNPNNYAAYGPNFWGLSACDTPDGYGGDGTPPRTQDDGTITPTSAIASLPYTPKESMEFAEAMWRDHQDAVGRYGFSNGVNPAKHWVGKDVIGIDLGMMMCGIENYRTGLIWKLSLSYPIVQRGYERAGLAPVSSEKQLSASNSLASDLNKGPLKE